MGSHAELPLDARTRHPAVLGSSSNRARAHYNPDAMEIPPTPTLPVRIHEMAKRYPEPETIATGTPTSNAPAMSAPQKNTSKRISMLGSPTVITF
jgi:hypothetical protein